MRAQICMHVPRDSWFSGEGNDDAAVKPEKELFEGRSRWSFQSRKNRSKRRGDGEWAAPTAGVGSREEKRPCLVNPETEIYGPGATLKVM